MNEIDINLPPITFHRMVEQVAMAGIVPWWRSDFGVMDDHPKGAGTRIGVVDTGVDEIHATAGALKGAVKKALDFTRSPSQWRDKAGHGTHVAGIIAARGSLFGMAIESEIIVLKALGDDGSGRSSWVAAAIRAGVDEGCHLINCSLGSSGKDDGIERSLEYAEQHGVLVFCASGNDGAAGVSSPADSSMAVAVGAIDKRREIAPFSNRGTEVDCVGPGVKILSSYKDGKFAELSGTSMSTPWVTGLFACLRSLQVSKGLPTLKTASEASAFMERICDDLGTLGRDIQYGSGVPVPSRMYDATVAPVPIVIPPMQPPADGVPMVVTAMYGERMWSGSIPEVTPKR